MEDIEFIPGVMPYSQIGTPEPFEVEVYPLPYRRLRLTTFFAVIFAFFFFVLFIIALVVG